METVLITGSNRGLGLEWARQYAEAGWRVLATCRRPEQAESLTRLARRHPGVSIHRLDVTLPKQVEALAGELAGERLDLLVNNAGVYFERWGRDRLGQIDYPAWMETFSVNTLGAFRVTEALLPCLVRSEKALVVNISSHMGSIADIQAPNDYAYRSSKAALNAASRGLAHELAARGIGLLLLHPGWVRTRMGGESAPLSVQESVHGMREIVQRFDLDQSGHFYRYDGVELPW
ncbi:MAG: short-chain dehydrogenase [Gammaproteobacteria bacterium]|nr:MAG: short-chain dehydrogenase [Gammaproteobacteria bacterium]RTZ72406.1 MAG: short-chain dehydrogenase [Gammaproteobacteria bacterium]RTZ81745.1 MAG: short-chain dehydrogenase [Gammaproteobacteria bacterium]